MLNEKLLLTIFRWGGISNIVGGLLVAIAYLSHPHYETPEVIGSDYWLWTHVIFVFSLLFGIYGLIGLMVHSLPTGKAVGLIGYVVAITSLILISGLNYYETFINPVVATEAPQFVEKYGAGLTIGLVRIVFPATGGLFVLGYILFASDLLRSRQLGGGAPTLMIIGVVVFGAGLSGFFPMVVVQGGSILFGAATAWLGYELLRTTPNQSLQSI